jgi:hypothetical protein
MKRLLLTLLLCLLAFASDKKMNSTPIKSDAISISELLTILDEEEGFYRDAYSAISPNGKIVVADAGNNTILVYDSEGNLKTTFGKQGSGPGEFNSIYNIGALKSAIAVRNEMRLSLFKYDGTFIKDISLMGSGVAGSPVFLEDEILVYYSRGENKAEIIDTNGEVKRTIKNKAHKPASGNNRMMVRIGGPRPIPFKNSFLMASQKEYKYQTLDQSLKSVNVYTRDFNRVERDIEELMKRIQIRTDNNNSEAAKRQAAQMKQRIIKRMGKYEDDIQDIIGTKGNDIYIQTASKSTSTINLDVIRNEKLYSQKSITFDDEVRQVRIDNGKLIVGFRNDEKGPYIKIFDINTI